MLSPKTAERLGLKSEDAVELKYQGRTIVAPAWVMPGHADESVTVFLGYGRTRAGRVGTGVGFDAGWIRPLRHAVDRHGPRSSQDRRPLAAGRDADAQHDGRARTDPRRDARRIPARIPSLRRPMRKRILSRSIPK